MHVDVTHAKIHLGRILQWKCQPKHLENIQDNNGKEIFLYFAIDAGEHITSGLLLLGFHCFSWFL